MQGDHFAKNRDTFILYHSAAKMVAIGKLYIKGRFKKDRKKSCTLGLEITFAPFSKSMFQLFSLHTKM